MSKSWLPERSKWAIQLERLALYLERPVNQLIGNKQLNPFYHTGAIAFFLLSVIAATGFYIFLFYQYGFDASYNAVVTRIEAPFIARIARAIHRYASGALVITTFLHAFRMLFMERFRGPRMLAWITGVVMTFVLWLDGIAGYWLAWDVRSQLINDQFMNFLAFVDEQWLIGYRLWLLQGEQSGESWPIFLVVFGLHIGLFLLVVGFFVLHVRHLKRVRFFPEVAWVAGAAVVLVLVSVIFPTGILPQADLYRQIGEVRLDPIFLYYLPLNETPWANYLWAFMWLATAVALTLPWLTRRLRQERPLVRVIEEKCTGCTKCANDCPYGAIEMVERDDNSRFQLLAIADPSKCVGCGICVGSCDDFFAITLGDADPEEIGKDIQTRLVTRQAKDNDKPIKVIFTCQRHGTQSAAPFMPSFEQDDYSVDVVALPCTGAIQPSLLPLALAHGASEVQVVGCPPYDCINREGNIWEEQRVLHERVPRLRKRHDHDPITAAWLSPDTFSKAISLTPIPVADEEDQEGRPDYLTTRAMFEWLTWQNLAVGAVLLGVVLIAQIWFTGLRFTPPINDPAVVEVIFIDPSADVTLSESLYTERIELILEIDREVVWTRGLSGENLLFDAPRLQAEVGTDSGQHEIKLWWQDPDAGLPIILLWRTVDLQDGDVVLLHNQRGKTAVRTDVE